MKRMKTNKLTKQIICVIIVLMLCNFIIPNYSYAVDTEDGGSLMEVVSQFLCFIPDVVIDFLQDMFVTPERIEQEDGSYSIKYSPGVIFSGEVPALDINFIEPGDGKTASVTYTGYVSLQEALELNGAKKIKGTMLGMINDIKQEPQYEYDKTREIDISTLEGNTKSSEKIEPTFDVTENKLECAWYNSNKTKIYVVLYYEHKTDEWNEGLILYEMDNLESLNKATQITGTEERVETKEYDSSAGVLQSIVATWYNALRRIALVGLLSAIVYIGIKIILTSTSAKDKAKYKSMLKDWLVALCLLFTLHYIMSITITVVNKMNEVINATSIASNGEDILMTSVRNRILNGDNWSEVLTYVAIYFVLMVYTIIYTIQYIRRIAYMAFLTAIAPLITLTYPLDKIKDSKAQAFDMWIKDYIFFSLIQVVHLLIYYIFLGSAIDLTKQGNWLYAIVAIGFITPAEKLIKKMFGFEKSKTLGALAAGATGALVMNAIQKIPQAPKESSSGKKDSSTSGATKAVRTAGANPFVTFTEDALADDSAKAGPSIKAVSSTSPALATASNRNNIGGNVNTKGQNSKTLQGKQQKGSKLSKALSSNKTFKNDAQKSTLPGLKRPKRNIFNGVKAVAGKYFVPVAGGAIRTMAGATGAIIGFSSGIAQGDPGKAITGLTVGAAAGKGVAEAVASTIRTVEQIPEKMDEVVDTWREGAYGKEVAQNAKFDRVFRNSRDYKDLRRSSGLSDREFEKKVQKMLDSGISDSKKMSKILKNIEKNPKRYNMENAMKYSEMAEKCSEDILYDNQKFIKFCQDRKISISEEELSALRKDIMNFK